MGVSSFTSVPIGDGATVGGWAITLVTFLLIGVPTIYLLVMLATDDDAFDRAVSNLEEHVEVKRRAQEYASSWDVDAGLEQPTMVDGPSVVADVTITSQEDEDEVHAADPLRRRRLGARQPSQ